MVNRGLSLRLTGETARGVQLALARRAGPAELTKATSSLLITHTPDAAAACAALGKGERRRRWLSTRRVAPDVS